MTKILANYKLMTMNYEHFNDLMKDCEEIFKKWDKEYQLFKQSTQFRSQNTRYFQHVDFLQKRLSLIQEIRKLHFTLNEVIQNIINKDKTNDRFGDACFLSTKEINEAYSIFDDIDILNSTDEGENAVKLAKN